MLILLLYTKINSFTTLIINVTEKSTQKDLRDKPWPILSTSAKIVPCKARECHIYSEMVFIK